MMRLSTSMMWRDNTLSNRASSANSQLVLSHATKSRRKNPRAVPGKSWKEHVRIFLKMYDLKYLYFMADLRNLPSIMDKGILSYNKVRQLKLEHRDFSDSDMQERREKKIIPVSGRPLHDYAPLYFATHTPMQYILTHANQRNHPTISQGLLGFIKVDAIKVFSTMGVVFTDGNAGRYRANFYTSLLDLDQLRWDIIAKKKVFGNDTKLWKCAEVLVPDYIPPDYFSEVSVFSEDALKCLHLLLEANFLSKQDDQSEMKSDSPYMIEVPCNIAVDETLYYRK